MTELPEMTPAKWQARVIEQTARAAKAEARVAELEAMAVRMHDFAELVWNHLVPIVEMDNEANEPGTDLHLALLQVKLAQDEGFTKRSADSVAPEQRPSICGAQSHDRGIDEDDPPVTCTEAPGHAGDHGGGTRCGTITWPNDPRRARLDEDGTAKPLTEIVAEEALGLEPLGIDRKSRSGHSVRPEQPNPSLCGVDPNSDQTPRRHACPDYGRFPCRTCGIPNEEARLARAREADSSDARADRPFPVLYQGKEDEALKRAGAPCTVPWSLLKPHEQQAYANHGQTLERLAERGGLGLEEMVAIVEGKRYGEVRKIKPEEARAKIEALVAAHEQRTNEAPPTSACSACGKAYSGDCDFCNGRRIVPNGRLVDGLNIEEALRGLFVTYRNDAVSRNDRQIEPGSMLHVAARMLDMPLDPLVLVDRIDDEQRPQEAPNDAALGTDDHAIAGMLEYLVRVIEEELPPGDLNPDEGELMGRFYLAANIREAKKRAKWLRERAEKRMDNPRPAEPEWVALAPNKGTDSPAWVDRIESRNPDDRHGQRSESLCDVWPSPDGTSAFENAKRIAAALNGARTDYPQGVEPDGIFEGALVQNPEDGRLGIVKRIRLRGADVTIGKRGKTQYWQHPTVVGRVVPCTANPEGKP